MEPFLQNLSCKPLWRLDPPFFLPTLLWFCIWESQAVIMSFNERKSKLGFFSLSSFGGHHIHSSAAAYMCKFIFVICIALFFSVPSILLQVVIYPVIDGQLHNSEHL